MKLTKFIKTLIMTIVIALFGDATFLLSKINGHQEVIEKQTRMEELEEIISIVQKLNLKGSTEEIHKTLQDLGIEVDKDKLKVILSIRK